MSALLAFLSVPPSHLHGALLFLAESFADHFVDRRLHKARRDRLAVVIALPIIRNHMPVMHDIRVQLCQRLDQSREPGIRLFEGRDRGLEIVDLAKRFIDLPMPRMAPKPSASSTACRAPLPAQQVPPVP